MKLNTNESHSLFASALKKHDHTIADIARTIGVSHPYLLNWKKGYLISDKTAIKVCIALGIDFKKMLNALDHDRKVQRYEKLKEEFKDYGKLLEILNPANKSNCVSGTDDLPASA